MFFANSRLWLGANLRCLWWKRVALGGNEERLVRIESFLLIENWLLRIARQGLCKRKLLVVKKTAFECII